MNFLSRQFPSIYLASRDGRTLALAANLRFLPLAPIVVLAFVVSGCATQQAYPIASEDVPEFIHFAVQKKYPGATAEQVQRINHIDAPNGKPLGYRGFIMRDQKVIAEFQSRFTKTGDPADFITRDRDSE